MMYPLPDTIMEPKGKLINYTKNHSWVPGSPWLLSWDPGNCPPQASFASSIEKDYWFRQVTRSGEPACGETVNAGDTRMLFFHQKSRVKRSRHPGVDRVVPAGPYRP
jgi:hypothetical protein